MGNNGNARLPMGNYANTSLTNGQWAMVIQEQQMDNGGNAWGKMGIGSNKREICGQWWQCTSNKETVVAIHDQQTATVEIPRQQLGVGGNVASPTPLFIPHIPV